MSMTSCWGVKYLVIGQSGETGKLADGVPQEEMSIVDWFCVSAAGTSGLCIVPFIHVSIRLNERK